MGYNHKGKVITLRTISGVKRYHQIHKLIPLACLSTHTPSLSMWVTTLISIYQTDDPGIVMPTHVMSDRDRTNNRGL